MTQGQFIVAEDDESLALDIWDVQKALNARKINFFWKNGLKSRKKAKSTHILLKIEKVVAKSVFSWQMGKITTWRTQVLCSNFFWVYINGYCRGKWGCDPYKEPQSDPVEDIDPTELTGKLIAGQVETRKLWKSWLAKKKTVMPAAKVERNAELSTTRFFKV